MKKTQLTARCVDCAWKDQIDREKGRTGLSWFCPKSGLYLIGSERSLHARRQCLAFSPKITTTLVRSNNENLREIFQAKFGEFLHIAKAGEQRCFKGERWNGNAVLIVVDAALDSIGLNYFTVVVPRVRQFYEEYVKNGEIISLENLIKLSYKDSKLMKIMNNQRVWRAAINISRELCRIRKENRLENDLSALRFWADRATYEKWKDDPIGKIHGVGLITFQYLRMQAGVDATMPDKIIKRKFEHDFGIKAEDDIQFIRAIENFSNKSGYSQTLLCWAIWLAEAGVKTTSWEIL